MEIDSIIARLGEMESHCNIDVSRQAKGANLRHEVYHPESISDSICQGLRKWHSHP